MKEAEKKLKKLIDRSNDRPAGLKSGPVPVLVPSLIGVAVVWFLWKSFGVSESVFVEAKRYPFPILSPNMYCRIYK
jgi:hypothetical protein